MALIDLQSDLTWTGNVPPGVVNYSLNNSAIQNNTSFTDEYNKFKVRDESYNATSYFRQPFILRGIQRDGKSKNQRWGTGTIEDGFIRSGIVTATERSLIDTARIGKFLAKPRGISFLAKQVGLQLSNPNVESALGIASLPFAQATKIFTPGNLLANTAGSAFGLRFKRHGLTPIGGAMTYQNNVVTLRPTDVQKVNFNRLVNLKKELFKEGIGTSGIIGKLTGFAEDFLGVSGTPIMTLTGVTGPSSVYGAGITTMRRTEDTSLFKQLPLLPNGDKYGLGTYGNYVTRLQYSGNSLSNLQDRYIGIGTSSPNVADQAEFLWSAAKKKGQVTQRGEWKKLKDDNVGAGNFVDDKVSRNTEPGSPVQNYAAVAYGKLKRTNTRIPDDFRDKGVYKQGETPFIGDPSVSDYETKNLAKEYGIGDPGLPGLDRSDYTTNQASEDTVDKVNNLLSGETYGDKDVKDLIKFIFLVEGWHPIIFRAFLTNVSDSFSPTTKGVQKMGFAQDSITYNTFSRQINISFIVAAQSRTEMQAIWKKLDSLGQSTYPKEGADETNLLQSTYLTIGNMYKNLRGYISSLNYDWDTETPWDLDYELPFYTIVDISFDVRPYDDRALLRNFGANKVFNGINNDTYKGV